MARIKNISGEGLCLFRADAPHVDAGDTVTVRDEVFVGRAWPTDIWEVVEPPEGAQDASYDGAVVYVVREVDEVSAPTKTSRPAAKKES